MSEWTPLLVAHTSAAAVALVLGAFNLLRKPRGDGLHRAVGYTWVVLLYWVAVSSFWIREINDGRFSFIHLLSVVTLVTLSMGLYHAVRRNTKAHRGYMRGTYFGLLGAFIGAVAVPDRLLPQFALKEPVVLVALVATLGVVLAVLMWASRRSRVRLPRSDGAS